jgi:hypothetical protein
MSDLEKRLHLIRIALDSNGPPISKEQQRWLVDKAIAMMETLDAVEWVTMAYKPHPYGAHPEVIAYYGCPYCGQSKDQGHAPDCPRQAALKGSQS